MASTLPGLLWTPSRNRVEIDSPLASGTALAHLQVGFSDEFRGKVEGNGVKLWRSRGYAVSRGSFAPIFYGVVTETATGSRLSGHFQMHPMTRLYTAAWIGLSSLLALVFLVVAAQRATPESTGADALPVLLVALLPLTGTLLVRFQQSRGRADEEAVREWIGKLLENPDSFVVRDVKRET
ncbi:MAG: hypothetical protein HY328_00140 [Chloroflexi bacterium]|nr:hypothetical protein [Chloroflexota bacterium]